MINPKKQRSGNQSHAYGRLESYQDYYQDEKQKKRQHHYSPANKLIRHAPLSMKMTAVASPPG
jgi:hypothetical protein